MRTAPMQNDDGLSFVIPTNRLRDVGETVEQYDEHFLRIPAKANTDSEGNANGIPR